jgi:hypothetical protein
MKKIIYFFTLCLFCAQCQQNTLQTGTFGQKMLRHVVLFKFKSTSTPADVKKIEAAFGKLPAQIPEIKGYEWGLNNSPEKLNDGFTHCFTLSFANEKGREVYLPHPAHKVFVDLVGPHVDKVCVVDYWTE